MKKILRINDLTTKLGISRTTFWRLENDPEANFPSKVKIHDRSWGWIDEEVDEWLESRKE